MKVECGSTSKGLSFDCNHDVLGMVKRDSRPGYKFSFPGRSASVDADHGALTSPTRRQVLCLHEDLVSFKRKGKNQG